MANVYQSATDLIGKTPLLEVTKLEKNKGLEAKVLVKLEYFNTSGSVKDRAAYYMVKDAEEKGLLKEGSVIIEKLKASKSGTGFNAADGSWVDMVEAGIIDPVKVSRSALQNAASVASLILTTEAVVADHPEENAPAAPAMDPSMMGGMM